MKEYTKSNHLKQKIEIYTWLSRLTSAGTAAFFVIALLALPRSYAASAISAALFLGCCSWNKDFLRQREIYTAGFEGEQILRNALGRILSNEYSAFFNVIIDGVGEIDCFVIGPSGLYVFEAKNNSGEIIHDENGWWRIKGKGRFARSEQLKSPSAQLLRTLNRLKRFLKKHGINVWLEGVIVFTNPAASLTLAKEPTSVKAITIHQIESVFREGYNLALKDGRRIESLLKKI